MKQTILISMSFALGALSLSACDSNKNQNSPEDRPPVVNSDATPPVRSDSEGSEASANPSADTASNDQASTTTGDSVRGTGDTRPPSKVIDDTWITSKTKTALLAKSDLKARDIEVKTQRGTVTLTGSVPSRDDSDRAEQVARNIEGVRAVDNRLAVK